MEIDHQEPRMAGKPYTSEERARVEVTREKEQRLRKTSQQVMHLLELVEAVKSKQQESTALDVARSNGMNAISTALYLGNWRLLSKVLQTGANPNFVLYRLPLEKAKRLAEINELLFFGADPRKCKSSPLVLPLCHYLEHRDNDDDDEKKLLLQGKALQCIIRLLEHKADPNQKYIGETYTPNVTAVEKIVQLRKDGRINQKTAEQLLRPLLDYGATIEMYHRIEGFHGAAIVHDKYNQIVDFMHDYKDITSPPLKKQKCSAIDKLLH